MADFLEVGLPSSESSHRPAGGTLQGSVGTSASFKPVLFLERILGTPVVSVSSTPLWINPHIYLLPTEHTIFEVSQTSLIPLVSKLTLVSGLP